MAFKSDNSADFISMSTVIIARICIQALLLFQNLPLNLPQVRLQLLRVVSIDEALVTTWCALIFLLALRLLIKLDAGLRWKIHGCCTVFCSSDYLLLLGERGDRLWGDWGRVLDTLQSRVALFLRDCRVRDDLVT